jgi:hypothetical protein
LVDHNLENSNCHCEFIFLKKKKIEENLEFLSQMYLSLCPSRNYWRSAMFFLLFLHQQMGYFGHELFLNNVFVLVSF